MTRKSREWYPNVKMHITSRGNRRNDIFRDDEDYQVYLSTLEYILEKANDEFELLSYVLEVSRCIHLNPVRAKMVEKPEDYCWSSYSMYTGKKRENLIHNEVILSYFKGTSRELYKQYVESAIG